MVLEPECPVEMGGKFWLCGDLKTVNVSHLNNVLKEFKVNASFPRSARLINNEDFNYAFSCAEKSSNKYFTFFVSPNKGIESRLGLAISKKVVKKAVDRNRIKRLVREEYRRFRYELYGVDLIIACRRKAIHSSNRRLSVSLTNFLTKLNVNLCGTY